VLNRLFANGVASGRIDEALIPLILYLTSRRLGLVLYLRGSDIRRKHGQAVAQTSGIVCVNGVWQRVPVKTDESTGSFVLHELLDAIGFIDWAMAREGDWIFPEPHRHSDPSKYASQLLNRRMVAAGAKGASIETVHSLRGDGIDELRDADIQPRAARLQSGHAMGSLMTPMQYDMETQSLIDDDDYVRVGYFLRKYTGPTSLVQLATEGLVDDFFGAWEPKDEEDVGSRFEADRQKDLLLDIW
jgi:integrase